MKPIKDAITKDSTADRIRYVEFCPGDGYKYRVVISDVRKGFFDDSEYIVTVLDCRGASMHSGMTIGPYGYSPDWTFIREKLECSGTQAKALAELFPFVFSEDIQIHHGAGE